MLAVFQTDTGAKDGATQTRLDYFHSDQDLLDYLNYPAMLDYWEMRMKEIPFHATDTSDGELFRQKTREYFQQRGFAGTVSVYETTAYQSGALPLFSETNAVFSSGGRSEAILNDKNLALSPS